MTGCGASDRWVGATDASTFRLAGHVHGGQQPVAQSTIQLYAAGRGGNGTGATALLTHPVITDANGGFNITGDYACASGNDQVYIVSLGGNPGLSAGTNNSALVMVAALGSCSTLTSSTEVTVNEVTTVAAAWALAQFMSASSGASYTTVAASKSNYAVGLSNAFLDAQLLVDTATGGPATLPANLSVETGKVNALANALASCVNSDGGAACLPLFTAGTPLGGTAPNDTLSAALNIVRNPGSNIAEVYNLATPAAPFSNSLNSVPNDWTMSLTVTGGGLANPTALDVDAQGNVWVADYPGGLSAFSPQGLPLSSSGYGSGTLNSSSGLTIDTAGNIWVLNEQYPGHGDGTRGEVSVFSGSTASTPGALQFSIANSTINTPLGLAADTNGNVLIANGSSSMVSIYRSTGASQPTLVATGMGSGVVIFPEAVTADSNHGLWLADEGSGSAVHIASDGTIVSNTNCCAGADSIVMDSLGNVWVSDPYSSTVAEVAADGAMIQLVNSGGISSPGGLAIDAGQNVWVTNIEGHNIAEVAGSFSSAPGGGISPTTGYGKDAQLQSPHRIVPDASGNLWISNFGNSDLVMLFGLATPTATPVGPVALAP